MLAVATIAVVVVVVAALMWTPAVSLAVYSAELRSDGYAVYDISLSNPGGSPRMVTIHCSFTVGNSSFTATCEGREAPVTVEGGSLETEVAFKAGPWASVDPADPPRLLDATCVLMEAPAPEYGR